VCFVSLTTNQNRQKRSLEPTHPSRGRKFLFDWRGTNVITVAVLVRAVQENHSQPVSSVVFMNGNIKIYLAIAIIILWAHTLFTAHVLVSQQDERSWPKHLSHITDAIFNRTSSFHFPKQGDGLALGMDDGFTHMHSMMHAEGASISAHRVAATGAATVPMHQHLSVAVVDNEDSYHVVFSTGCSEFQDWQSVGVYSSAEHVGQRGPITRIASGCTPDQEVAIRHAMSHLPKRCRVHFAPNTKVRDHSGSVYKYANKPLGMMHWLMNADPPVAPSTTVALVDPDMFFLRPLWHDSFDEPSKYVVTGGAQKVTVPKRIGKGTMIAQQYQIGGAPWTKHEDVKKKSKPWALDEFFSNEAGRPFSPALAADLNERTAGTWYSIGAPYIALAEDWLPISTNWTSLMPMAVERNYGNLAEMYAMTLAVADLGIRPARIDNLMVSDIGAPGEGWPWIDELPLDKACDPSILTDPEYPMPTFLHYCQRYEIEELKEKAEAAGYNTNLRGQSKNADSEGLSDPRGAYWMFTKYQVPDEILQCPKGSKGADTTLPGNKKKTTNMKLGPDGLLPEPPIDLKANTKKSLRSIFSHCSATRATNQAAKDFRRWFCNAD